MSSSPPRLDGRTAAELLAEMRERLPGYVPGWNPAGGDLGWALLKVYTRYLEIVGQRLDQMPEKNRLAFWEWLGMSLLPSQAARAPVVFQMLAQARNSYAPAQTRLAASLPGRDTPIYFETERGIGLAAAALTDVFSLWPGRDAWVNHSAAIEEGRPFRLFDPVQPTDHILYLGHDLLFALRGRAFVAIGVDLAESGAQPLDITWEYFDGEAWVGFRSFDDGSMDATGGLIRSGTIRLATDCADAKPTEVNGVTSHWVRGRVTTPLPPSHRSSLPVFDVITVRAGLDRTLPADQCAAGLAPDSAFADGQKLDTTKEFQPLGSHPRLGSAFYFSCDEAFSKPGARVTVCLDRVVTPQEKLDGEIEQYVLDLDYARQLLIAIRAAADAIHLAIRTIESSNWLGDPAPLFKSGADPIQWYANAKTRVDEALKHINAGLILVPGLMLANPIYGAHLAVVPAIISLANAHMQLSDTVVSAGLDVITKANELQLIINSFSAGSGATAQDIATKWDELQTALNTFVSGIGNPSAFLADTVVPDFFEDQNPVTWYNNVIDKIRAAREELINASIAIATLLGELPKLDTAHAAALQGNMPPNLDDLELVWEYWNGTRWVSFYAEGDVPAYHFRAPGRVLFTVPEGWEPSDVFGDKRRWVRVRHIAGTYGLLRLISWFDEKSKMINVMPMIEPRPPTFSLFYIGYDFDARAPAQHCFACNDFAYRDHTVDARWPQRPFAPFVPVADDTPTLYLGFDQPLPADRISLYLNVREVEGEMQGASLAWEMWDGEDWQEIAVEDETADLALPGMLALVAPGDDPALARFGTPRHWLRGRLHFDGDPIDREIDGIHLNAVWASQVQTIRSETLGSGSGQPRQTLFFRNLPVLDGEIVEVRELDGARAEVELPILEREMIEQGVPEAALPDLLRKVRDPRTGRIREVWVCWEARPHLYFSSPHDRHYMIDRHLGRVIFGDARHGRIPPAGANNIAAQRYRSGGGLAGNVPAGAISKVLGMLPQVRGVTNVRAAEAGAAAEQIDAVQWRAPQLIKAQFQAITPADYESLARMASPAVAVARALPVTHPAGWHAPGWVRLIIIPHSEEARPEPSFLLRQQVQRYLLARVPAAVASRLFVTGPDYLMIDAEVTVAPYHSEEARSVREAVLAMLGDFLHPLRGGPEGRGWPFGRSVYLSDLAAALERIEGVDSITALTLLVDHQPQGQSVIVPPDRMVAAGRLRVRTQAAERR